MHGNPRFSRIARMVVLGMVVVAFLVVGSLALPAYAMPDRGDGDPGAIGWQLMPRLPNRTPIPTIPPLEIYLPLIARNYSFLGPDTAAAAAAWQTR